MVHELFGAPERMHDVLSLALVDGALIIALPLLLVGWLLWRDNRRERNANAPSDLRIRKRRRRRKAQ